MDLINQIIQEIVDPSFKLKDILLEVKILAFKINNPKLKKWVEVELNGYSGEEIPQYRIVPAGCYGNLIQDRGFGSYATRNNSLLPVEYLEEETREALMKVWISNSVSELESMVVDKSNELQIQIPHLIYRKFSNIIKNGWVVDSAWQRININSIEGILSSIRSNLLTFLLELLEESGQNKEIDFMGKKQKIDKLFDKTIGSISGRIVNISVGSDFIQSTNTGEKASSTILKGDHNTQMINGEIAKFVEEIKSKLEELHLDVENKEDLQNEIIRLEAQLRREKPTYSIIQEGLIIIKGILMGMASNLLTQPFIEKIGLLLSYFSS